MVSAREATDDTSVSTLSVCRVSASVRRDGMHGVFADPHSDMAVVWVRVALVSPRERTVMTSRRGRICRPRKRSPPARKTSGSRCKT